MTQKPALPRTDGAATQRAKAGSLVGMGAAEEELEVEFFFEEIGGALSVAKVFGDIAAGVDLDGDTAALEGSAEAFDALAVRMIETFGDADDGGDAASDAFVVVVEGGIAGMVAVGLGLAVVVANDSGDDLAIAAFEAGDIAVEGEIFAMLVMAAVTDAMTDIVEKRARFELHARLNRQVVERLKLIEEHEAEFADMLGVALIVIEAAAETAGGHENLAGFGVVAMGLFAGEGIASNFLQNAFAEANTGNGKGADVEIAAESDEDEGGDGHDVGAIAADAVGFHTGAHIATEDVWKTFAQQRNF